ncbi:hypothetical protein ACIQGZ_17465 [Streptomyces sp. NPDC092296]|uniref:hypothetical protein n=1 Tax=Streptomyces sp. NPDC092296 TaxID=3366012 RepID=UPI0038032DED
MTRAAAAAARVLLLAAVAGCSPVPATAPAMPDCPTYRESSGVYVIDGEGERPCIVRPSRPLPPLTAQDYGVAWRHPTHAMTRHLHRSRPGPHPADLTGH